MNAARILNMARRRAGLTQRELARRAGIPQPSISRIERDQVSPTVDTLERLLRACDQELEAVRRSREGDVDRTLIDLRLRMSADQRVRRVALEWARTAPFRNARPVGG
jgi:transcriptional regulator with XRE-family HTH domain